MCFAGHWQNKAYPYAAGETLGDGILGTLGQPIHYWWCWLAIGVCIAYILLFNVVIVILLTILPGQYVSADHTRLVLSILLSCVALGVTSISSILHLLGNLHLPVLFIASSNAELQPALTQSCAHFLSCYPQMAVACVSCGLSES